MNKIVTAGTLAAFRHAVQEKFNDGWSWVDGGGSVGVVPGKQNQMSKMIGGFWAVVTKNDIPRGCDGCTVAVTAPDKTQGVDVAANPGPWIREIGVR